MESVLPTGWDNFYLIAGGAAGGLAGITFVVITLVTDTRRVGEESVRGFVTPIITHFGAVLCLSAFITMPGHTATSLSLGIGAEGLAGLIYMITVVKAMRRMEGDYMPVFLDWIWNAGLPALCYALLLSTAFWFSARPTASPYCIAATVMLLMTVSIYNAWDIAVFNSINKKKVARTS
jgi:hypothetical protein